MKKLLTTAIAIGLSALAWSASAQTYPTRPVRVVIPFPPGGTLDTVGRMLAQKLGEQTGQTFIIDNKPGGNGTIGADAVAKAPADGYTLLFNASTFTTAPMTMKSVPYKVGTDFSPIALVAKAPLSVAINKNLPITDIKSLLAHAKANPGKMSFAVGSIGSAGHLSTELLKRAGHIDYLIVPYKGTAPAFQDLIGGQMLGGALFAAHFQEGRDIGDKDTLADIAAACGERRDTVREWLDSKADIDKVQRMVAGVRKQGIEGVPCYILNRKLAVSGAQSAAVLGAALLQSLETGKPS